jgi:hypothetical protein
MLFVLTQKTLPSLPYNKSSAHTPIPLTPLSLSRSLSPYHNPRDTIPWYSVACADDEAAAVEDDDEVAVAIDEDDEPAMETKPEIDVTVLSKPDECELTVDVEDAVYIMHEGYAIAADGTETQIDANPPKSKDDPTPEPLKVFIGKGHVLAGMDLALRGRCVDEEINVVIPPALAFDDPSKNFGDGPDDKGAFFSLSFPFFLLSFLFPLSVLGSSN